MSIDLRNRPSDGVLYDRDFDDEEPTLNLFRAEHRVLPRSADLTHAFRREEMMEHMRDMRDASPRNKPA